MNNLTHLRIDCRYQFLRFSIKQFFKNEHRDLFPRQRSSKKIQSRNILIVDDNEDIAIFLSSLLSYEGFSVSLASNGLEAIQLFHEYDIDLIFTDICMPGINGNILCKKFKLEKDLPVIAVTTTPWLAGTEFDQIIHKPFGQKEILEAIDSHLALSVSQKIINKLIHKQDKHQSHTSSEGNHHEY